MINSLKRKVRGILGNVVQKKAKKLQLMQCIKILSILELTMDASKMDFFRRKLGYEKVVSNCSQKIWLFYSYDVKCEVILDHNQCSHVRFSLP